MHKRVDCVVFAADDAQARLYLLNLNRLVGRDNVYKKAKLVEPTETEPSKMGSIGTYSKD